MQKINSTRSFLALSVASLALLPLVGAVQAQGGPPDFAPAYGRRNRDNNGNNANQRGRNLPRREKFGTVVTLEGVVTANSQDSTFEVRAGGQTFDVRADADIRLVQGDRVVLRGSFDGDDNFNAQNVRVLGRGNGGRNPRDDRYNDRDNDDRYNDERYNDERYQNGQRVTFPATFIRVLNGNQIEVRSQSGRTFRVESRDNLNSRRSGDRVFVSGIFRDNRIVDARVTLQNGGYNNGGYNNGDYNNGGYDYNSGTNRTVDFPARIVSIDTRNKRAEVRGENGRTYRVEGSELNGFRVGERVRVRGVVRASTIDLQNLDRIR